MENELSYLKVNIHGVLIQMTATFVHLFNAENALTREGIELSVGEKLKTTISAEGQSVDVSLGKVSISYNQKGELETTC